METFRIQIEIENPARPGIRRTLENVLVDTGAELTSAPAYVLESLGIERYTAWHFRQADGTVLERWTGTGGGVGPVGVLAPTRLERMPFGTRTRQWFRRPG